MRGKKTNSEFISSFIEKSIADGYDSIDGILNKVNLDIKLIDQKIKEVEELKKIRCGLIDVKEFITKTKNK